MKIKDLILKLREFNQEQEVHIYQGIAREFESDFGWECTNVEDSGIQVFFEGETE